MCHKIQLPKWLLKCPPWWINFIESLDNQRLADATVISFINKHLSQYNASWQCMYTSDLIFETEEDATAFILRWS